jgi:hypothetical protein
MKLTGENRSTRRKTCPSATLSTTNPTWADPGSKPGLRGEGRRLTTWAMARPNSPLLVKKTGKQTLTYNNEVHSQPCGSKEVLCYASHEMDKKAVVAYFNVFYYHNIRMKELSKAQKVTIVR